MPLTEKTQTARGLIPVAPIRRLIECWASVRPDATELLGWQSGIILGNTSQLAFLTGLNQDTIAKIRFKESREWIEFDTADKIVCAIGGEWGWHSDPELNDIYQGFDFSALDRKKPTTRVAA